MPTAPWLIVGAGNRSPLVLSQLNSLGTENSQTSAHVTVLSHQALSSAQSLFIVPAEIGSTAPSVAGLKKYLSSLHRLTASICHPPAKDMPPPNDTLCCVNNFLKILFS